MSDRKKYLAAYYQKNKHKADERTKEYYRKNKAYKQAANKKYRDKVKPNRNKRV